MYDYLLIGAGVIGSMVARELSKYQCNILVLEKENDVANVQTLANSAIIHAAYSSKPGSLKSVLNLKGNIMYDTLEKELNIPLLRSGAYVVAHDLREEKELERLALNAKDNGVDDFEILDYKEAIKTEPNLSSDVTKVLSLPTTKVTYPWEVAFAAMENAIINGVTLKLNSAVTKIEKVEGIFKVTVNNQEVYESLNVINAAGVASDDIAGLIEENPEFKIKGRKGEYFVVDKRAQSFVNHVLYPLPSESGKGVLVTPQVHGEVLLGPNSKWTDDKYHPSTSYEGLDYVKKNSLRLATNIPFDKIIRSFAGVRASSTYDDFYIKESREVKGLFHLGGIESPGLSAAPAIAEYLVEEMIKIKGKYELNLDFNPYRKKSIPFNQLEDALKRKLYQENNLYGRIICKCEQITEKEIIDAIHGPLGSDTIKGIKKRTRAGAGMCQGGYCEEKVMKIIAREKQISPLDVAYDKNGSRLFVSETKAVKK
jgi:glycerol-3-phosphate dehydrogenase